MISVNRVEKIIQHKGLSINSFEKLIGTNLNSIHAAIKRKTSLKDTTLNKILNTFPEINPEWLLTGNGEMFRENGALPPVEQSKNSPFYERLLEICQYKGFKSINDFAVNGLRYDSSEKLNRLKKEENKPSYNTILDITNKFTDINPEWLLSGKGEMLKKSYPNNMEDDIFLRLEKMILDRLKERENELLAKIEERDGMLQLKIEDLKNFIKNLFSDK